MKKLKRILTILLSVLVLNCFSQEEPIKEVTTKVNEVTVYLKGAQVTRNKDIDYPKGTSVLKFTGLSPFIDTKSIQVKVDGNLTVLSVNHQQNFLNKNEKPDELIKLENKRTELEDKLKTEETHLEILSEELKFLQDNRSIGGKNQELNLENLKATAEFYNDKLTAIKMQEIERRKSIIKLKEKITEIDYQIHTLSSVEVFATGEVFVKVKADTPGKASFSLSYLVNNAGWFPSYDIRCKTINEPLEIIYKANVRQDTKVDWDDVKIRFSSTNPQKSNVAPQLIPYFIDYNSLPPSYKKDIGIVSGKVFDSDRSPLPGANVVVKGTTIGTITDMNGNYSITLPPDANHLTFSFIGFKEKTLPIRSETMNVTLEEDILALDEVVTIGYGVQREAMQVFEIADEEEDAAIAMPKIKIRGTSSIPLETAKIENQTAVDFEIKMPYTIKSGNKSFSVDMNVYSVPAEYKYLCIPKVDPQAYLQASIVNWEKLSLLEGEANLFFEDTYRGKSILGVKYASDTLSISLGPDKNVSVHREKIKDYTTRQFIGNKKQESRTWKTTIKNNKAQNIAIEINDQVPIPTLEEIELDIENKSGASYDEDSGKLTWDLKLDAGETKEVTLKYSLQYPKNRNLVVE